MKTKSKRALEEAFSPLLTRDDIAALLVAYYGAVALDQVRADDPCRKCSRSKLSEGRGNVYRTDHRRHIHLLLDTLSHISEDTLARLTVLAATRKPTAVRKVLRRLLAEGSGSHVEGECVWTAREFFSALVEEVDQSARAPKDGEHAVARMMLWLDPLDPLRICRDCRYKKTMPPKIWR
jgi:hypothetical protein